MNSTILNLTTYLKNDCIVFGIYVTYRVGCMRRITQIDWLSHTLTAYYQVETTRPHLLIVSLVQNIKPVASLYWGVILSLLKFRLWKCVVVDSLGRVSQQLLGLGCVWVEPSSKSFHTVWVVRTPVHHHNAQCIGSDILQNVLLQFQSFPGCGDQWISYLWVESWATTGQVRHWLSRLG